MPLKVRTVDGGPFCRCGIMFSGNPVVVPDEKLEEKWGSPAPAKKNPETIKTILLAERMLVCEKVDAGCAPEPKSRK